MKLLMFIPLMVLGMCEPPMPSTQQRTEVPTLSQDTIPTIELTPVVEPSDSIVLVIYPKFIRVKSSELNTIYTTEPTNVFIKMNEQWGIEQLSVDGTTLLGKKQANHTYLYGEDVNTIIAQPGNNINSIVDDHRRMGYQISVRSIKSCNPFLSRRGLQVGDLIKLSCN